MFRCPEAVLRHRYVNLLRIHTHDSGGHFAALEEPRALANDIARMVSLVEARAGG
jgi:hypothetical protein